MHQRLVITNVPHHTKKRKYDAIVRPYSVMITSLLVLRFRSVNVMRRVLVIGVGLRVITGSLPWSLLLGPQAWCCLWLPATKSSVYSRVFSIFSLSLSLPLTLCQSVFPRAERENMAHLVMCCTCCLFEWWTEARNDRLIKGPAISWQTQRLVCCRFYQQAFRSVSL